MHIPPQPHVPPMPPIKRNPAYIPQSTNIPINCKNCGAPLTLFELQCQYCGTICTEITPAQTTFTCYADDVPYITYGILTKSQGSAL